MKQVPGVYTLHSPGSAELPLLLDSPHSGTSYPDDFDYVSDLQVLRRAEDTWIHELYQDAPEYGASLLQAEFPRSYIDPNRALEDIDQALLSEPWSGPVNVSAKTGLGIGLIWRKNQLNENIYDRQLSNAEVAHRIEQYWKPYHQQLEQQIERYHSQFGAVWHVDCHSMPQFSNETSPEGPGVERAEFCLGDRHGTSCDPEFVEFTAGVLKDMGYVVALNTPYAGVELVRAYSDPGQRRNSLQLEIRRDLYMDEKAITRSDNFTALRTDLNTLMKAWAEYVKAKL